jgi:4a-hydroxytetrahydrobiopterin dehydratase
MIAKLSTEVVASRVAGMAGWSVKDDKLHREYKFADFVEAFGFMASCALVAQAADHHPEWFNVWNRVVVDLTTHDAGGISERDFALAGAMDKLAAGRTK